MDQMTRTTFENLWSEDGDTRYNAFNEILALTDEPVDWAYEVWDQVVEKLHDKGNHQRAIAAQLLCNLSKSDPQRRMLKDIAGLLAVTKDERFVTARHCLQSLWKVGAAGDDQRKMLLDGLSVRFSECISEKNCTLIRYDIIQDLRNLYDVVPDEAVKRKALALIDTEQDLKYRKKYSSVWRVR